MIISLPGIPEEADSMLSDYLKKKLAMKHEGGRIDVRLLLNSSFVLGG